MEGSLTSSQIGCFISFSTWQALVVTELTPEHHSTEKSQGWFTTYKLTEMLSWRYCLHGTAVVRVGDSSVPPHSALPERAVHLGYDPALAAIWSDCLEIQTQGRCAGKAEDRGLQPAPSSVPALPFVHKAHTQPFPAAHQHSASAGPHLSWPLGQCPDPHKSQALGKGFSPDLLRAHVLVGQIDVQYWLLLILESLPAVHLLDTWGLLFDVFPEPIRKPEDLGKSQRARAEERCSREFALFQYSLAGPGTHGLLRQLLPAPHLHTQLLHKDLSQESLLRACPSQEVSTTGPTEGRKQFQPRKSTTVKSFLGILMGQEVNLSRPNSAARMHLGSALQ